MRKLSLGILIIALLVISSFTLVSCGSLEMLNDPAVVASFVGSRS